MPDLDDVPAVGALDGLEDRAGLQARLEDRVGEVLVEAAALVGRVLGREVRELAAGGGGAVIALLGLLAPLRRIGLEDLVGGARLVLGLLPGRVVGGQV